MKTLTHPLRLALVFLLTLDSQLSTALAQSTAFTYQGRLDSSGSPYSGQAEFQATLWNAASGGSQLAGNSPATVIVGVTNGLFLLPLDFGANFPGADRWLQLEVRTNISTFTLLLPRQKLTATPYALYAVSAGSAANVTGTFSGGIRLDSNAGFSQSSLGQFDIDSSNTSGGRFTVLTDGRVGMGTRFPGEQLDVLGAQAGGRFTATANANGAVLTLRNTTASPTYLGAINFENAGGTPGQIACLPNDTMIFRSGGVQRVSLDGNGNLSFGTQTRQMLNLWGAAYGIGVQTRVTYFRSGAGFCWYVGGGHNDAEGDAGGGSRSMTLNVTGDLRISGAYGSLSDRNSKQDFEPINGLDVLGKVAALPLSRWSFKTDTSTRHLGPMAQDFHAAFGLNGSDDTHITTVDADGVALAAIQGLNQKVEDKSQKSEGRIQKLEAENAELKRRLDALEQTILNRKPN